MSSKFGLLKYGLGRYSREYSLLVGDLFIPIVLAGDVRVSGTKFFEGMLDFSLDLEGALTFYWIVPQANVDFNLVIGGGFDVYLGPFWDPDEPLDGFWVPDAPVDGFWVPDVPVSEFWVPIKPDRYV